MADLLVVEDDPDAGEALSDILRAQGHEVRIAFDGEGGLRLLAQRQPDLALVDVDMPILDGPGMVMTMFVHNAGLERVPVILVSGVPDLSAVASQLGTPYYLTKPFRFALLGDLLRRALSERTPPSPRSTSLGES